MHLKRLSCVFLLPIFGSLLSPDLVFLVKVLKKESILVEAHLLLVYFVNQERDIICWFLSNQSSRILRVLLCGCPRLL